MSTIHNFNNLVRNNQSTDHLTQHAGGDHNDTDSDGWSLSSDGTHAAPTPPRGPSPQPPLRELSPEPIRDLSPEPIPQPPAPTLPRPLRDSGFAPRPQLQSSRRPGFNVAHRDAQDQRPVFGDAQFLTPPSVARPPFSRPNPFEGENIEMGAYPRRTFNGVPNRAFNDSPDSLATADMNPYFAGRPPVGPRNNRFPPPPVPMSIQEEEIPEALQQVRKSWRSVNTGSPVLHSANGDDLRLSHEASFGVYNSADASIISAHQGIIARNKKKFIVFGVLFLGAVITGVVLTVKFFPHGSSSPAPATTGTSSTVPTVSATPTTSVKPTTSASSASSASGSPTTLVTSVSTSPTSAATPTPTAGGTSVKYAVNAPLLLSSESTTGITGFSCNNDVAPIFKDAATWTLTGPSSLGGYTFNGADGISGVLSAPSNGVMTSSLGTQKGSVTLPPGTAPCDFTANGQMTVNLASNSQTFFGTLIYTLSGSGNNCPIIMTQSGVKCVYAFQGQQS